MIAIIRSNDKHPRTRMEKSGVRLALTFAAGTLLLLSFMISIKTLSLFKCPFLALTGLPCPFCGLTRSIWAISAGDWFYATINYPLAWLIYAVVVILFARGIGCLIPGIRRTKPFIGGLSRNQANHAAAIIIGLVLLNWIYRLSLGLT